MGLQRITAGQPFSPSARTWNAFAAAAEAHQLTRANLPADFELPQICPGLARVENNSGAARERGHVLGLGDPIVTPSTSEDRFFADFALIGATPTLASHRYKFGVLLTSLAPGEIGWAVVSGIAKAKVNIVSTVHPYATVKNSDATQLDSYWWGRARILWQESGTGSKWCVLELGDFHSAIYRGKTAAAHDKGDPGTINHYSGAGAAAASSGATITSVYNAYADLATSKWADVAWVNDGPELIAGECDP